MNNSTKVTIGIGALFLLAGIGLTFLGGSSASGIEDFDVEEDRVWSGILESMCMKFLMMSC